MILAAVTIGKVSIYSIGLSARTDVLFYSGWQLRNHSRTFYQKFQVMMSLRRRDFQGKTVGLFTGLLIIHGLLNSIATRHLASLTKGFVFVNLGATFGEQNLSCDVFMIPDLSFKVIIIVLLAKTPRSEMHAAGYVFGSEGIVNQTGGWNTGIAFLFGLLSVQWTVRLVSCRCRPKLTFSSR